MKNNIIDKVTSLGITLALGSAIGLSACGKKENNYIPMTEIFYDENADGIDETFEQQITDSNVQIENIIKLEDSIELIKKLHEIDFKNFANSEYINITKQDIDNLNIDEIEKMYEEYQSLSNEKIDKTDYQKQEQLYNLSIDLYDSYIKLNTFINNNGYSIIHDFGMDLYKAIIIDAANFSGNETNVIAIINQYQGSGSENSNKATYTSDKGYQVEIGIDKKSKLYSLIGKVSEYQGYNDNNDTHIVIRYDENNIEEIEEVLAFYKECIYTNYEVKENYFTFVKEPEILVSKKTNVPTR